MNTNEKTFERIVADFKAIDWKALGRAEAISNVVRPDDLAGYSNPNCSSTPWSDAAPKEASEFSALEDDYDISDEEREELDEILEAATDDYNTGYADAEDEIREGFDSDRLKFLETAGAAGWRIARVGIPGLNTHTYEVFESAAEANDWIKKTWDELYTGNGSLYSGALTPVEADDHSYQDGSCAYANAVEYILKEVGYPNCDLDLANYYHQYKQA